jgi:hypothetical protein
MRLSLKERALLLALQYSCPEPGFARENYELLAAGEAIFGTGWIGKAEVVQYTVPGYDTVFSRLKSPELNMTMGRLAKRGLVAQSYQDDCRRCEWSPTASGTAQIQHELLEIDAAIAFAAANAA